MSKRKAKKALTQTQVIDQDDEDIYIPTTQTQSTQAPTCAFKPTIKLQVSDC